MRRGRSSSDRCERSRSRSGQRPRAVPPVAVRLICSAQHARFGPTRIVATTRFVAGSMRETLGPPAFGDPDGAGRDGDSARLRTDMDARRHFVRGRVDARDRVVRTDRRARLRRRRRPSLRVEETLIRATIGILAPGRSGISVASAALIAHTAPSPTVRAPPPNGAGAPRPSGMRATTWPPRGSARAVAAAVRPLLAMTARGAEVVEDALTRVERARSEAADPNGISCGCDHETGHSLGGRGDADRPVHAALPGAHVDPADECREQDRRRTGSRRPVPAKPVHRRLESAYRSRRSVRGSRRPSSARSRSTNQTFPATTVIPTGKPPTSTRVIASVTGSSAKNLACVRGSRPNVSAADCESERSSPRERKRRCLRLRA